MRFRRVGIFSIVVVLGCVASGFAQIDPKTAILQQAGFAALENGDARRAAEAFREALIRDPKNASLHLGAGVAAYLERRDGDAKSALQRALTLDPRLTVAREVLGRVLYRLGDLAGAVRAYEGLGATSAARGEVATTLDRWRRELDLHDRMQQAVGNHFIVSFEGPAESELAARALDVLERAYWRIGEILGVYPVDSVAVVLYTTEQFRDITRSPSWAVGAYNGTIRVPMRGALVDTRELDRVLTHEFTHALIHSLAAHGVPTWLNEGLAASLESDNLAWAQERIGRNGRPLPLDMLSGSFGKLSGDEAGLAYASSAVALRRLIDECSGAAIANLLRDLGRGVAFEPAFARRMCLSFSDFAADAAGAEAR